MRTEEYVRSRVEHYIADHYQWALILYSGDPRAPLKVLDDAANKVLLKRLRSVLAKHFTPDGAERQRQRTCYSWPPEHDPSQEKVRSVEVKLPGVATILTFDQRTEQFCHYELTGGDKEWLIERETRIYGDPDACPADQPDLAVLARGHGRPLVAKDFSDGLEKLFNRSVTVQTPRGIKKVTLDQAGEIGSPSGYLVCSDPGLWGESASVLELRVAKGRHPVEVVIDRSSHRVAAARVVFSDNKPVGTACATRWEKPFPPQSDSDRADSHYIGTDTGRVGLIDAGTLLALTRRQRSKLLEKLADERPGAPNKRFAFAGVDRIQAIAIDSGWGDGVYPAFWLLDAGGQPVQLLLDFGLLAQPVHQNLKIPLQATKFPAKVETPELRVIGAGLRFLELECGRALNVTGPTVVSLKAFDARGSLIFDSEAMDTDVNDEQEMSYLLPEDCPRKLAGTLEIRFFLGNRYVIV